MNPTLPDLITIQEASKKLSVSEKTLRRWEKNGLISSIRTVGGHRRYDSAVIEKMAQRSQDTKRRVSTMLEPVDGAFLYKRMHVDQKKVIGYSFGLLFILLIGGIVLKGETTSRIQSITKENIAKVLAAQTTNLNPNFIVNVPAIFKEIVNFAKDVTVDGQTTTVNDLLVRGTLNLSGNLTIPGDLAVNGGDITTNQTTFNLVNTTATTVNFGGAATTLSIGADTGTTTVNNDLSVGTFIIGGDTFTDLTGTGLQVSSGSLQTTLGTSIGSSEIDNDSIKEIDLNVSNSPINAYILTYNSSTEGFTWVDNTSLAVAGGWTDGGTLIYNTTSTDNVTIGGTTELGKLGIDGDTDEIQLLVQGNSTQTNNLVVFENSSGTDLLTLTNGGNVDISGHAAVGNAASIDDVSLLYSGSTASNVLTIEETPSDYSKDFLEGITSYLDLNPSGTVTSSAYGVDGEVFTRSGNAQNFPSINGSYFQATHQGSGTISLSAGTSGVTTNSSSGTITSPTGVYGNTANLSNGTMGTARGTWGYVYNQSTGTITTAIAADALLQNNNASGTVTTAYGMRVDTLTNAGTIGTTYGVYVSDITAGTQTNTPFSFYASDANAYNYFAGRVGVGTASPEQELHVESTSGPVIRARGSTANDYIEISGDQIKFYDNGVEASQIFWNGGAGTLFDYDDTLTFRGPGINGATTMVFDGSNEVGIGDASPDAKLEVLATSEQLRLTHTDGTIDARITLDGSGDLTIDGSSDGTGSETFTLTGFTTLTSALTAFNCTDCIDFDDMEDTLDLDTSLTLNQTTSTWSQSFTGDTTTGFTYTASSLTSGTAALFTTAATAFTGELVEITSTGGNANNTGSLLRVSSAASDAVVPLMVTNLGTGNSFRVNENTGDTDTTAFIIDASGNVGIGVSATTSTTKLVVSSSGSGQAIAIDGAQDAFSTDLSYRGVSGSVRNLLTSGSGAYYGVLGSFAGGSSTGLNQGASAAVGASLSGAVGSGGTYLSLAGLQADVDKSGLGTIASLYGIRLKTFTNSDASGNITTAYGLALPNISIGSTNYAIQTNAGNIVFNEGGDASTDFRVEGDNDENLLFTDASADFVGIGDSTPDAKFDIDFTGTSTNAFGITASSLTSGKAAFITTAATAFTGNLVDITSTGGNANNTGTLLHVQAAATDAVVPLMATNLGTGISFRVNDETGDSDSSPFIVDAAGDVAIGTTTPKGKLDYRGIGYGQALILGHGVYSSPYLQVDSLAFSPYTIQAPESEDALDIYWAQSGGSLKIRGSGGELVRILNSGNFGIGIASPVGKLDVSGKVTGKALAIFNETGDQDVFTASVSGVTKFRIANAGGTFVDLPGTGTGNALCHTDATDTDNEEILDCTSAPSQDYAEMYPVGNGVGYGDIVAISNEIVQAKVDDGRGNITNQTRPVAKLVKSNSDYQSNVIGIVSNNYGDFSSTGHNVINPSDNPMPVALSGRVPVKVSSTSEAINPGDFLTTSNEPGRAMKALQSGYVIGKAVSPWNHDGDTVMVFVNNSYFVGDLTADGNLNNGSLSSNTNGQTNIDVGVIDSQADTAIQDQIASMSAEINSIKDRLSSLETANLTATSSAVLGIATDSATLSSLTVLGNSVFGDTVVNGKFNIGTLSFDNANSSIDSIGKLKIQSLALDTIEFQNDSIEMDKNGNFSIKKGVIIGNDNIRGSETLQAGLTQIQVVKSWESPPVSINATPSWNSNVWVDTITKDGFVLHAGTTPEADSQVYWSAIW